MHLVDIGQRAKFVRQIADRFDRAEIAIHRIDRFKRDQLWRIRVIGFHQCAQMRHVVVTEDPLGTSIAAHTLDHRSVVQFIRVNDQARKQLGQRAQRCIIGNVGGREQQGRFLAVQIRQFSLEPFVINRRARDVARTARPGPRGIQCFVHRLQNYRVLAHAQIVVAAPDGDRLLGAVRARPDCVRKLPVLTFNIDEGAVPSLFVQTVNRLI